MTPPDVPSSHGRGNRFTFAIVVPVRDEAALIEPFLRHIQERAAGAELVVVDGGSSDVTAELAARHAPVLRTDPGRARQMNAGAWATNADVLWFVHVDSWLPERPLEEISAALSDPATVGGCFRLEIPDRRLVYRLNDRLGNVGVDWLGIAGGDHGIFVRRPVFEQVGGYPDVPLLEDMEFYRRCRRWGRMQQLRSAIRTSPRRWEQNGAWRTTAIYAGILALYGLGMPIDRLNRLYRRLR